MVSLRNPKSGRVEHIRDLPAGELIHCGRCGTRVYGGHDTPTPDSWHPNKAPRGDGLHRRLTLCGYCLGAAMTGLAHERRSNPR